MSFFDLQGLLQAQEHRHTPRHTDKIKHVFFFTRINESTISNVWCGKMVSPKKYPSFNLTTSVTHSFSKILELVFFFKKKN